MKEDKQDKIEQLLKVIANSLNSIRNLIYSVVIAVFVYQIITVIHLWLS